MTETVRAWVSKAEEDWDVACHELGRGEKAPVGIVCFLAQQTVEKYIKALLVARGVHFPKVHDLAELLRLIPAEAAITISGLDLSRLSEFAVEPRYPELIMRLGRNDAIWAVDIANRCRDEVRARLPAETL